MQQLLQYNTSIPQREMKKGIQIKHLKEAQKTKQKTIMKKVERSLISTLVKLHVHFLQFYLLLDTRVLVRWT